MKRIQQSLVIVITLLAVSGCGQKTEPESKCFYTKLPYLTYAKDQGKFEEPKEVNATHSIYRDADVLALHDNKEHYKSNTTKSNKTRYKLNKLWGFQ